MAKRQKTANEWVGRILHIRQRLALNQSEFAARINYSAMAVSRWESGAYEPTAEAYVQMGNLADGTESTWFWTRAGLKSSDLSRMLPEAKGGRDKAQFPDFEIVVAGSGARRAVAKIKAELVAIPVLNAHAGSHGLKGDNILDFDQADVADVVAAPALWCPNPTATNCLRVRGDSLDGCAPETALCRQLIRSHVERLPDRNISEHPVFCDSQSGDQFSAPHRVFYEPDAPAGSLKSGVIAFLVKYSDLSSARRHLSSMSPSSSAKMARFCFSV
jgi:transcriptional regulator with XRE-family HTH domain